MTKRRQWFTVFFAALGLAGCGVQTASGPSVLETGAPSRKIVLSATDASAATGAHLTLVQNAFGNEPARTLQENLPDTPENLRYDQNAFAYLVGDSNLSALVMSATNVPEGLIVNAKFYFRGDLPLSGTFPLYRWSDQFSFQANKAAVFVGAHDAPGCPGASLWSQVQYDNFSQGLLQLTVASGRAQVSMSGVPLDSHGQCGGGSLSGTMNLKIVDLRQSGAGFLF